MLDVTREAKKAEKKAGRQQQADSEEKKTVEQVAAPK